MYNLEIQNENKQYIKNKNKYNFQNYILYFNIYKFIKIIENVKNYKFIYIFLILFIIIITFNNSNSVYNDKENEIYKKHGKYEYLKVYMINKFNSFIKKCHNINNKDIVKYPLLKNPKISVIMPIYNGGKYLYYSLSSIQNQKMKEIEIILIDDNSLDDSIKIIKNMMKNEPRIRLIKNNKNKKILYSKSIAALNSNGEYIIELDQDDMFIRDDIFDILYNEARNYKLDLVQIRDFVKKSFFFNKYTKVNLFGLHFIHPQNTHYETQPNLKEKFFNNNNNFLLWGLLIKNDLYKNAIYHLWPIIINYNIVFNEDYIITFMILIMAQKYKYINKFGLIHLIHKKSASNEYWKQKEFYLSLYFYIYYLYNYYIKENPQYIKIIINYINTDYNSFINGKKYYPILFDNIINLIINSDYLLFVEKKNFLKKLEIDINENKLFNMYKNIINNTEYINIYKFQKLISYKNNNTKEELIKKKNLFKITIIIYCIDFIFLEKTLNSIIHQINITYEIIIIYDNNGNISLKDINKYKNFDENITIINNNKQKGLMASYSLGVLKSKGEYILTIISGYTLSYQNVLSILYKNVKYNNNIDILEFNLLLNNKNNFTKNSSFLLKGYNLNSEIDFNLLKNNNHSTEFIQGYKEELDVIYNKLIKAESYKNIIIKYNLDNYNETIYNYYENILIYLFNKNNFTFIHINIIGIVSYIYNSDILKINNIKNNKYQKINDSIFYINFLFNKSDSIDNDKKYVLQEFINIMSIIYNKFNIITDKSIKLFEKFLNSKYINNKDKNELIFFYKSLMN